MNRRAELKIIAVFAFVKLAIHVLASVFPPGHFGFFRDELYYIACGHHLAWGYVDQPPLTPLLARASQVLWGNSLLAIRLLPAVAGALAVALAGLIARELGGRRSAVTMACLCVLIAPAYLTLDGMLTMNAFEPLFWCGGAWIVLLLIRRNTPRLWIAFGALAGLGILNKWSMLFFGAALLLALVLTRQRRLLASGWFWAGGILALLLALPNFLWQAERGFPFFQLLHNIAQNHRDVVYSPIGYLVSQIFFLLPLTFPVWLCGLIWCLGGKEAKSHRWLGWIYVFLFIFFVAMKAKNYYLLPIYPILFGAGGAAVEAWTARWRAAGFWRWAYATLLVAAGVVFFPAGVPVLNEGAFIHYAQTLNTILGAKETKFEHHRETRLPQIAADMHGWPEMVEDVARVYNALPPEDRRQCGIFVQNYGDASAIDFFGPKYGLPPALSGHQSYWYWGPHGFTGQVMIVLDDSDADERKQFASVEIAGKVNNEYARADEQPYILVCRGFRSNLKEFWPKVKHWD